MTWLSPAYPIGGFSYTHGVEYAVEQQLVTDCQTLTDWIATIVQRGAGRIDGALLAAAWRGHDVKALAKAWRGTSETALESAAQGTAFMAATAAAWPHEAIKPGDCALPVAAGIAAAAHGVDLRSALVAYLQAFAANLVSAGVRLIPLGQSDGQRAIAALERVVLAAAETAMAADLDRLGTAAPMVDWCSMRHETQYTRLFRS